MENLIQNQNPEVFKTENLYSLTSLKSEKSHLDDLGFIALSADRTSMTTSAMSGMLHYYIDRYSYGEQNEEIIQLLEEIATEYLLKRVQVLQDGFFLESQENEADLFISLRTGVDFIKCGEILEREILCVLAGS